VVTAGFLAGAILVPIAIGGVIGGGLLYLGRKFSK
jgi:hypothetical protein